jgi:succinylarginine dihydrolase
MDTDQVKEVIFVGLPGPTHNYSGLARDNVAASLNRGSTSNPKQAALQALELARLLCTLGIEAAILPPQLRPHLPPLRERYTGRDEEVIIQAARDDLELLEKMSSSSAMWAANAATIVAGPDSRDHKLHLTSANLHTNMHRRIEAQATHRVLSAIFGDAEHCAVHAPLDAAKGLRDEGAANHMRLAPQHAQAGLNVFVYGTDGSPGDPETARQTLAASKQVARQSGLDETGALFVKQNPAVIREGVFHNDVIAVSNASVLLVHEQAYGGGKADIARIEKAYAQRTGHTLTTLIIGDGDLSVEEAVHTYFFNSQIVTRPDGRMAIIAPVEVKDLYAGKAARLMEAIRLDPGNPIAEIHFADLRQSMNNGGGPACLRLRVPMSDAQIAAVKKHTNVLADAALLTQLRLLIEAHYPNSLESEAVADPALYRRCLTLLTELSVLMKLPLLG